jgi:hypothetical protein
MTLKAFTDVMTPEEKRIRPERLHNERLAGTRLTRRIREIDGEPVEEIQGRDQPHDLVQRITFELITDRRPEAQRAAALGQPIPRPASWVPEHLSDLDIQDALTLLDRARRHLESMEHSLIQAARERHLTWRTIASELDLDSPQAAAQRYERMTRRAFPTGWEEADSGYTYEPDQVVIYDEHHRRTPGGGHTCQHDVREVGCTHANGYPEPFDERTLLAAQCRACQGQGFTMTECASCGGSGRVFDAPDQNDELGQLCRACAGQGLLHTDCSICESTGKAPAASAGPAPFDEAR